jgi:methylenetetrahydrofolate dehydrogenase (NADP+)/methenyltetrahydrofolate cyclohydrolase
VNLATLTGVKIDGLEVAKSIKSQVTDIVNDLKTKGITPCLATVLVGNSPASATYVRNKHKACEDVGILTKDHTPSAEITQAELNKLIEELNQDETVHGILVQLPLPSHLNEFITTTQILPEKDVDGLTPPNVGLLSIGKAVLVACTPSGIIEMCKYYNIELEGKNVVIINRSNLVGKPLYHLLLQNNATVTTCHSKTKDLKKICLNSDIIITGVGNRDIFKLTPDMIKEGAVVIDVATTRHDEKLSGDADYSEIIEKASFASPVPGGVGPMTVAMLLKNTVTAAAISKGIDIKS